MARAIVLGSAQDGGLPQVGSSHANDLRARRGLLAERTAASLAVVEDDWVLLFDASPDLRLQLSRMATALGRPDPLDAIVLTHAHMGHYTGLVQLGPEASAASAIPAFMTEKLALFLAGNQPWASLIDLGHVEVKMRRPSESFVVPTGSEVTLIEVPHRPDHSDSVAVSYGGTLLYAPDIDDWGKWPEAREIIGRHEIAFLDATFWSPSELPGRSVADIPHPMAGETLELVKNLDTRVVLTHLNHTNPLCDPGSPESAEVEEAGVQVAFDGMDLGF